MTSSISKQDILNNLFSTYCPIANVAEYFYIIGIDSNIALNEQFNTSTQLNPSLISQFPPFTRPYSTINTSILITHCFPQGFKIISSTSQPEIEVFHFNLDNLLHLDEVPKLYFTALLFYEPLSSYTKFRNEYKRNIKFGIREQDTNIHCYRSIYQRSHSQFQKKFPINEAHTISNGRYYKHNKSSHKYIHNIDIDNNNIYKTNNEEYIPKVLCISSRCPFPREFHKVLKVYYDYIRNNNNIKYPIEKLIEVLTLNIPLPTPGMITYNYILPNNKSVSFKRTDINKRNIISYKMNTILNFQDKDIIDIYRFLLYENPILFFSKDKGLLTNVVNTFLELLYPFKYQYPNIAILPIINYGLIEIEECFCFGINDEYTEDFFIKNHLYFINKTIQIADIDNGILKEMKPDYEQLPMIKLKDLGDKQKEELKMISTFYCGDILKSYKQKLSNKLAMFRKSFTQNIPQSNEHFIFKVGNIDDDEEKDKKDVIELYSYNDELSDIFYEYIYTLMADYHKGLNQSKCKDIIDSILHSKKKLNINDLFNIDVLDLHGDKALSDLMRTKLFYDFIERNYLLNSIEDKITFLFFGEMISYKKRKNKNKKDVKLFCEDSSFSSNQSITFRLPHFFTKDELYYIKIQPTIYSPLMYYQRISNKKIYYFLFPKLLYDNTFFPNKILHPSKPLNIDIGFKLKLTELFEEKKYSFSKYEHSYVERFHLNPISKVASNQFGDYSLLNMLYIFAMVFHYCEYNEKHFRFYEMLEIVEKLTYVDRSTFALLFASVVEHGTVSMAIKLYETIQKYDYINKYSEYAYLCNKLSCSKSHMKRNSLQYSKITLIYYFKDQNEENKFYETTNESINALRKRTFNYGESDLVVFDSEIQCEYCQQFHDVIQYSLQYDKMDYNHQMAPCSYCHKHIIPLMFVRIGNETSICSYKMCNPYYLYMFYIKNLVRDYRTMLDLNVLRNEYEIVFWNCVWYMYMTFSSFDILLTYKEEKIQNRIRRLESFLSSVNDIGNDMNKDELIPTIEKLIIQNQVITFCYLSKNGSIINIKQ